MWFSMVFGTCGAHEEYHDRTFSKVPRLQSSNQPSRESGGPITETATVTEWCDRQVFLGTMKVTLKIKGHEK